MTAPAAAAGAASNAQPKPSLAGAGFADCGAALPAGVPIGDPLESTGDAFAVVVGSFVPVDNPGAKPDDTKRSRTPQPVTQPVATPGGGQPPVSTPAPRNYAAGHSAPGRPCQIQTT